MFGILVLEAQAMWSIWVEACDHVALVQKDAQARSGVWAGGSQ